MSASSRGEAEDKFQFNPYNLLNLREINRQKHLIYFSIFKKILRSYTFKE